MNTTNRWIASMLIGAIMHLGGGFFALSFAHSPSQSLDGMPLIMPPKAKLTVYPTKPQHLLQAPQHK